MKVTPFVEKTGTNKFYLVREIREFSNILQNLTFVT